MKNYNIMYKLILMLICNTLSSCLLGQSDKLRNDSIFYSLGIYHKEGWDYINYLADELPVSYLIEKIDSLNDEHHRSIAFTVLGHLKNKETISDIANFLKSENKQVVGEALATLLAMETKEIIYYINEALLADMDRYINNDLIIYFVHPLKEFPEKSTIPVLDIIIQRVKEMTPNDYYLIRMLSKLKELHLNYLSNDKSKMECINRGLNNLADLGWALRRIKQEGNPAYIKFLKESKYRSSIEVLLVRKYLSDPDLTTEQIMMLEDLELIYEK